jgi:hypothetical protein
MAKKFHPSDLKWHWFYSPDGSYRKIHEDDFEKSNDSLFAPGERERVRRAIADARAQRQQRKAS